MRKKIGFLLFVVCVVCGALMICPKAQAATATKEMDEGKTYRVDLDGDGRKESLKLVTKESHNRNTFKIYVNGKKKYSYSYNNEHCWTSQSGYADFNARDKRKEIFATFVTDNANIVQIRMFQYKKGKIKTICVNRVEENRLFGG